MTYQPKSDFLHAVAERGFLQDCTDLEGLDEALLEGPLTAYIGFDCTAPSLHVGHLTGIMMLRWFQKTGHNPIVLMGGGTTKIGDPSGKDEARQLLTDQVIGENMASIRRVFTSYLDFAEAGGSAVMINNADWLDELRYIPFLRDYGRHFTINRMLTFESVKLRLEREQPLTFLEFNYMLLQAYDFLELYKRTGCRLQMGGSDQWGNIVNGVDLTRRVEGVEVFGMTAPLLTTADGKKMGKTAGGAVWLNADQLSPWDFWQYWRNVADADVGKLLRRFTELPMDEIRRLEVLRDQEINEAKKILATEVTALCHGREAAEAAERTARETFEAGGLGGDLPEIALSPADFAEGGLSVVQLFLRAGLAKSGKDAKRLIAEGGARMDDAPVTDASLMLGTDAFAAPVKLSAGKKRHAVARLN
ncbi:tyrosine--tRNA ligase [Limibaculum sp. M0105]|uniref:Tyrosine--tRNA ligase n=1 Tax=Thermohalobaculum xanthum TaxID=2753746 RepID=A0A8J7M8S4_9RHOB|nr:tyrosine--tRNA ligase [Thermohalobaculum xanthum]MBK0400223.1 tyrosine--tRNA ligase [Thermohalobaculum xanthum]